MTTKLMALLIGCALASVFIGAICTRCYIQLVDLPGVMALRSIISEEHSGIPPSAMLQLIDLYETEVREQMTWPLHSRVQFRDDLFDMELRRFIFLKRLGNMSLADQALRRAAAVWNDSKGSEYQNLEEIRMVADKRFPANE